MIERRTTAKSKARVRARERGAKIVKCCGDGDYQYEVKYVPESLVNTSGTTSKVEYGKTSLSSRTVLQMTVTTRGGRFRAGKGEMM